MRFYQSQQYNPQSLFVQDTTPWDALFKVAEQQQQKHDKTQAEVDALDNLQVIGGLATPHFAKQVNQGISKYKQAANNEMLKGNTAGVLYNINEVKKLLNSPEAIAATEDYKYNQHSAKAYQETLNDPGAYAPWFNRENNQVVPAQDASTFNPATYYSSVKSGDFFKEHLPYYNVTKPQVIKKFQESGFQTKYDAEGNPFLQNEITGEKITSLDDARFRDVANQVITQDLLDEPFAQSIINKKAKNKNYSIEDYRNDFVRNSAPFWNTLTEELQPKYINKNTDSGSSSKKTKSENYPLPISSDVQFSTNQGYANPITGKIETPNSVSEGKEFLKTFDLTSNLTSYLQNKGINIDSKRINSFIQRDLFEPSQIAQYLKAAGVDESKANIIGKESSEYIFNIESQKNNLEQSLNYVNNQAAKGLNLKYDSKTGEYNSNADYDLRNKAELNAKRFVEGTVKNSLNELKLPGGINLIDLSSTKNTYGSKEAEQILEEWKSIEPSIKMPKISEITIAATSPNSKESKEVLSRYATSLALESQYTDKFYSAIQKHKTIEELKKIDPDYGKYFENREKLWSDLHKENQMGLDIYTTNDFGKVKGEQSAGDDIKKVVAGNIDNYKFYNSKNQDITNTILSKEDNQFSLQKAVDEGASVIVSDPYNKRFLLKVITGNESTDSGKVKQGKDSQAGFAYVDITSEVENQVRNGKLPVDFLQDFNLINSTWDEIKQLGDGDTKSLNDVFKKAGQIYNINIQQNIKVKKDKEGYNIITPNGNIYLKDKKELLSSIKEIVETSKQISNTAPTSGGGDEKKFLNNLFHQ